MNMNDIYRLFSDILLKIRHIFDEIQIKSRHSAGEGGGCSNSTSMVQPGMVPITASESTGCTSLAPQHNGHIILNPQGEPHPLVQEGHLPLAAWPVSGRVMAQKAFQTEWCQSCRCHGEHQRSLPIPVSGEGGVPGVLNDRLIRFQPL